MTTAERSYPERLSLASRITEPAIRQAIAAIGLPPGSRGLDVGCGIGLHTLWLAEAVGEGSHVLGVDISPQNLAEARRRALGSPHAPAVEFQPGDLFHLQLEADAFDWAFCSDVLWPMPGMDLVAGLVEIARVVRRGGVIAVLFWSGQQLLAGHPELEARLGVAHAAWNPYLRGIEPDRHFLRARSWMGQAGLESVTARTFVADIASPLGSDQREALAYCLEMFWSEPASTLGEENRRAFQLLSRPDSTEFVGDAPGYVGFVAYTLFQGTVT
jgi:demethylmenaquinone methyltransferase/2-methoxy-6-polyprenyl-1,4-benzoquinol methylase